MVDPMEPIITAPTEVQAIIRAVLLLERERLYEMRPRLNADVMTIIKEQVR